RHGAAMKTVSAVDDERVAGILPAQRVDHRAQGRETATPLKYRFPVFPEELVMDLELRVDVAGVKNRDVLRLAGPDRRILSRRLRRFGVTVEPVSENRTERHSYPHLSGPLDEIAPAASFCCVGFELGSHAASSQCHRILHQSRVVAARFLV